MCRLVGRTQQCGMGDTLPGPKYSHAHETRHDVPEQLQPLRAHFGSEKCKSRDVAPWMAEATDESCSNGVVSKYRHHDRNFPRHLLGGLGPRAVTSDDNVKLQLRQ